MKILFLVKIFVVVYNAFLMKMEEKIVRSMTACQHTLAVAESCTGGLLANRLTNVPGSSAFFKLGIIAYSNEAKIKILKVPKDTLKKYGAVHEDIAIAMAQGVRKILNTHFGIGITGIAGPTGATKLKPLGLTYIAIATPLESFCLKCHFPGSRTTIKNQAATQALKLLWEFFI